MSAADRSPQTIVPLDVGRRLHAQPRFQSLVRQYQDIVSKQSALLAEMRRAGEVPYRPPQRATTSRN